MFQLASPYALLLLALIPAGWWFTHRRSVPRALASADTAPAIKIRPSVAQRLAWIVPALFHLSLILMIIALARPQWGTRQTVIDTTGINIVLAVDLSESMAAMDFEDAGQRINRLDAIKRVVREFIQGRTGDRIGMVVFGSQAYTQLPLTTDYDTISAVLERLEIGSAGRSTAIGDALGIALKRLEDIDSPSNTIILLTDGQSNSGQFEPLETAAIAKAAGVTIYTIGVGSRGRAPLPVDDPVFGRRFIYQTVGLDEQTLTAIAEQTGGQYFRATDLKALETIAATIDAMEASSVKTKTFSDFNDLYDYFLLPAFGLLGMWIVLQHTRYLTIP